MERKNSFCKDWWKDEYFPTLNQVSVRRCFSLKLLRQSEVHCPQVFECPSLCTVKTINYQVQGLKDFMKIIRRCLKKMVGWMKPVLQWHYYSPLPVSCLCCKRISKAIWPWPHLETFSERILKTEWKGNYSRGVFLVGNLLFPWILRVEYVGFKCNGIIMTDRGIKVL